LVKEPKLLLLDEPLSNLDARLRLEMREEIRCIQLEVGITAVFVTHDQEEAMSISDRIMLMKDGLLQQECAPQAMYRKPINRFAAEFIGSPPINMLENHPGYEGNMIGIRPEHLFLTDTPEFFQGELSHMETIGRDTMVRVRAASGDSVRLFVQADAPLRIGQECHVSVKPENIHCFDAETGERTGDNA